MGVAIADVQACKVMHSFASCAAGKQADKQGGALSKDGSIGKQFTKEVDIGECIEAPLRSDSFENYCGSFGCMVIALHSCAQGCECSITAYLVSGGTAQKAGEKVEGAVKKAQGEEKTKK